MLRWLRLMTRPDGALVRFNDCADGVAPSHQEIERYAAVLGVTADPPPAQGVTELKPSGYVRVARGRATAWLDIAPIGPDYLPGHAHADTLSFELSLGSRALIVNRGTSVYGIGERRQVERGTAAHSTVQIGAHDSSEVWAGFRVGRRARPGPLLARDWEIAGSHDGYVHLPGRPRHHRLWLFDAQGLVVEDRLDPPALEPAHARYHLAPGLELCVLDDRTWRVVDESLAVAQLEVEQGEARVERWQHAVRFGTLVEAQTVAVALIDGKARVRWRWES